MANLKAIRQRIKSVQNTKKITSAMRLVAAAKVRRAQMRNSNARPFTSKVVQMLQQIGFQADPASAFLEFAAAELGVTVAFEGQGEQEVGRVAKVEGDKAKCKVGDVIVRVDPRYYRPTEVETLLGDPTKAKEKLGWKSAPFTIPEGGDRPTTSALLGTCFRQVEYAGVLAGAKNPDAAEAFVEFMIAKRFQEALPDNMYVFPVNPDAALPEVWARWAKLPKAPLSMPADQIAAEREKWLAQWRDIVTS